MPFNFSPPALPGTRWVVPVRHQRRDRGVRSSSRRRGVTRRGSARDFTTGHALRRTSIRGKGAAGLRPFVSPVSLVCRCFRFDGGGGHKPETPTGHRPHLPVMGSPSQRVQDPRQVGESSLARLSVLSTEGGRVRVGWTAEQSTGVQKGTINILYCWASCSAGPGWAYYTGGLMWGPPFEYSCCPSPC